jgi:hypothetical protein
MIGECPAVLWAFVVLPFLDTERQRNDELFEFRRLVKVYGGLTIHQVNQLI